MENRLKIHIKSFSYKKGIPKDHSGHGGGFVFDCRAIHNPGRYEVYKNRTGLDPEVKLFLKQKSEMDTFLHHVSSLVSQSIEKYLEREFDSLTVLFGCTGGQHRSVYAAEQLKEFLENKYPIDAEVIHTEKENWRNS